MKDKMFNNIFKDKKVLITGHTGFKGSWLSIWLKELGADVIGYALDPYTKQDNFNKSNISDHITDIRGDVRDFIKLKETFTKYKPEFVFHLAAQPLVKESYNFPKETYDINISGTVNLLEACRHSESVKVIVNVTSDKCYENREWIWGYRENDPMGGFDPYSASKGCSELVTSSYRNSFFNPDKYSKHGKSLSTVRAGNVIGGGDWAKDRIIPDCIRSLQNNKDILIRNPKAIRPWQFVLEPLCGYLLLAKRMHEEPTEYAGAWNFGPEASSVVSVKSIVQMVIKEWGKGNWYPESQKNKPHEASLLALDINKAKHILNWKPVYNVDIAIKETIAWYKKYSTNKNMYDPCVKIIKSYINHYSKTQGLTNCK